MALSTSIFCVAKTNKQKNSNQSHFSPDLASTWFPLSGGHAQEPYAQPGDSYLLLQI